MERKTFYPLVVAYGFETDPGKISFLLPGREVTIEGGNEVLRSLLPRCNGYNPIEEIVAMVSAESGYEKKEVRQLAGILEERRVLVDACDYHAFFHLVSANPMPFARQLSEDQLTQMLVEGKSPLVQRPARLQSSLEQLLEARESVREFTGEPLSQEEIHRLAWAIYGRTREDHYPQSAIGVGTVPSGGALYPLRLFVFVQKESRDWQCCEAGPKGLVAQKNVSQESMVHVFLGEPATLEGVSAVYVLACDFQQTTQKYANRGYRYALLEAGHAAQNAYLWCAEQELGIVEIGGFNDKLLADLVGLSYPQQAPITTLLVGRRKPDEGTTS